MSIFDVLTMIGGLCLFLFGMDLMGQSLERRAGGKLRTLLDRMTGRVFTGFLTGLAITAVIQSSSATTVMVPDDPAAGHKCHHGSKRGHHGDGVAAEFSRY